MTEAGVRILGIDPGLRSTGFGLIDRNGPRLVYVASGRITSNERQTLPERIRSLIDGLAEIIDHYRPAETAIEQVFVNVNPHSTLLLGQARGAAIATLVGASLPVAEYSALQIKQAVVGHGKAAKQQVSHMVMRLLQLPSEPARDAADALACAICHAHARQGLNQGPASAWRMRGGRLIG